MCCDVGVIGHRLSVVGSRLSVIGYRASVIGFRLSDVGYRASVIGFRLSGVGYPSSVIGRRLSGVGYRPTLMNIFSTSIFLFFSGTRSDINGHENRFEGRMMYTNNINVLIPSRYRPLLRCL